MTRTRQSKPKYDQDPFDRGFIAALSELQNIGLAKNVAAMEEHLDIPKRTLYEVLKGRRGIPEIHKFKIMRLFSEVYRVNPKVFTNSYAPVFESDPPTFEEVFEPYGEAKRPSTMTLGDINRLRSLESVNSALRTQVKELRRHNKELQNQLNEMSKALRAALKPSGQRAGQK